MYQKYGKKWGVIKKENTKKSILITKKGIRQINQ